MNRIRSRSIRQAVLVAATSLALVACAGGPATGGASGTPTPVRTTGTATGAVPPSAPASSSRLPTFSGNATVLIEIDGTPHELTGGRCDIQELPADLGGGWVFALNLGTPSTAPGGPDYIGIVFDISDGTAPDGRYEGVLATATVDGFGFNIGDNVVNVRNGGTEGDLTGETRPDNKPVRAAFSC
jgi:hypothetical protein